jgi:hypothetical protein
MPRHRKHRPKEIPRTEEWEKFYFAETGHLTHSEEKIWLKPFQIIGISYAYQENAHLRAVLRNPLQYDYIKGQWEKS